MFDQMFSFLHTCAPGAMPTTKHSENHLLSVYALNYIHVFLNLYRMIMLLFEVSQDEWKRMPFRLSMQTDTSCRNLCTLLVNATYHK